MFWWLMKNVILGPILRLLYRPHVTGLENVPRTGGAILAPNHQSFLDDFLMPMAIRKRKVVMLAKADYFDKWWSAWFFKAAGCVPVRREGGSASLAAVQAGVDALKEGKLVGIFPEGTRSPDGRLYRGKTGVARMALEAQVPIIPVAVVGTYEAWPYHHRLPRPGRVELRFGKPLSFERHYPTPSDRFILRSVTDEVMYEIMLLSEQEYVDDYGSRIKKQIERTGPSVELPEVTVRASAERGPGSGRSSP